MQKPASDEYQASYQKYFDLVAEGNYLNLLRHNSLETIKYFERIPGEKLDYRYAEGKWTIKELLMHVIDTERVFSYRGLVAARGDTTTPHYRMDEELYARNVSTHQTHGFWMKVWKDLIHIAMAENVSKHFGEHGTVVEENFETAWPSDAQGV